MVLTMEAPKKTGQEAFKSHHHGLGSKSLHIYHRLSENIRCEDWQELQRQLIILLKSSVELIFPCSAYGYCRFPYFLTIKNPEFVNIDKKSVRGRSLPILSEYKKPYQLAWQGFVLKNTK